MPTARRPRRSASERTREGRQHCNVEGAPNPICIRRFAPCQAALATALKFPWSDSSRARAVVARSNWLPTDSEQACAAVEKSFTAAAAAARRALARPWPESEVVFSDAQPVDAILAEAKRFEASLIVLGWRGHGTFRRLLAGSVSRSVAAHAQCPVLVVREAPSAMHRFVVGFNGCPNAERALEFLSSLEPWRGSCMVLVNVIEGPTSMRIFPRPRAHKFTAKRSHATMNGIGRGRPQSPPAPLDSSTQAGRQRAKCASAPHSRAC